jgi:hypothetical protein
MHRDQVRVGVAQPATTPPAMQSGDYVRGA